MLVLRRKVEESICIADDIRVQILAVQGDTVQVGVEAPRHIPVTRVGVASRGPGRKSKA